MNESPKYVVSPSLQAGEWANSTILGPYRAEAIRDLTGSMAASTSAAAAP
jgi:hypothetical protein